MLIATVIFCVIAAALAYFAWKRQKLAAKLPPGPPALPLLGNMHQIDYNDPRTTFVEWHKKYGPIYTVWLGMVPNVFVTGFDLMQELFVKRGDEFADRPDSFIFETFTRGKYGIGNIMGDIWKEQRRFSLQTLRSFGFGRKVMEEKIAAETSVFLETLETELAEKGTTNLDVKTYLNLCINNIISSLMVGRTYTANDPTFIQLKNNLEKLAMLFSSTFTQLLDSFPWLRFVPLFGHFGYDDFKEVCDNFLEIMKKEVVTNKQQIDWNAEPTNFVDAYWKEIKKRKDAGEEPGSFHEWQLVAVVADLWSAALETTMTTLYWSFLLMMHYPEVQKKVQHEIDSVVGKERTPNLNDRTHMPYVTAVLHEIQRYANIIIFNVPHTVNKDAQVLNYVIPKGVAVIPHIAVVHYDDTIYRDPLSFDPDRFLSTKSEHLLPFSLGKRICLGESLARSELFLIFTSVMQKYTFDFVDGEPKPSLTPRIGFTAVPNPYNIRISRRTPT